MKMGNKAKHIWRGVVGFIYLVVAVGVVNVGRSSFETIVLAVLVQLYAAILYNFSLIGTAADINNYAAFVRFRILAKQLGVTENEDGSISDQELQLKDAIAESGTAIIINRLAHAAVSIYALFKIIATVLG